MTCYRSADAWVFWNDWRGRRDLCLNANLLLKLRIDPGRAIPCLNSLISLDGVCLLYFLQMQQWRLDCNLACRTAKIQEVQNGAIPALGRLPRFNQQVLIENDNQEAISDRNYKGDI